MERYLIVSMTTGIMDGWYFDYGMADMALTSLDEKYPNSEWVLTKVIVAAQEDGFPVLPDHLFHANRKSELD